MLRIAVSFAAALVMLVGSAQAVTFFYDDFSSGTLDQWTVVENVDIAGIAPATSAYFRQLNWNAPLLFAGSSYVLDSGQYQAEFYFMADAGPYAYTVFDLYLTSSPGTFTASRDTWFTNTDYAYIYIVQNFITATGAIDSYSLTPNAINGWNRVDLTFTVADYAFFSIALTGENGDVMLLDNVSISPLSSPVPEPTSLLLMGCGLAGVVTHTVRRRKA